MSDENLVHRTSFTIRLANLTAVLVPLAGLIVAISLLWGRGFDGLHLFLLLGMYVLTGLGITIGYHRLFTHRAFDTLPAIRLVFGILGSMAAQGPVLRWAATHRRHHQHSDHPNDPHSPHLHGPGMLGVLRGLWHAHVGWTFSDDHPGMTRYVGDLLKDRLVRFVSASFPLWVVVGLAIPTAVAGLWTQTWFGALLGFVWGGLVRIFLVQHLTFSINSICHLWGTRPYPGRDQSRNNFVLGALAFGEGWHNNHHAFPRSARHGLTWWQIDPSYWIVRLLAFLRLAWNVRVPAPAAIAATRGSPAA